MVKTGKFVISLDFELFWGMRDHLTLETYGEHILGVQTAFPRMVEAFEAHQVKATFATVGFLFADDKKQLIEFCPEQKPQYDRENLSPYNGHLDGIGENEDQDKYHFAPSLVELLRKYPEQEIASHTFSHYYCLVSGQTKENFREDMIAAVKIAEAKDVSVKSIIFPRNQFNEEYLKILKEVGITSYRGNEKSWFFNGKMGEKEKLSKRALRLLDSYINISGHNCYDIEEIKASTPYNIPSSRFLRPYSPTLSILEPIRLKRILDGMTYAAKNKKVYHLWWHPHNFGVHQEENFKNLDKILGHYDTLNSKYGFESLNHGPKCPMPYQKNYEQKIVMLTGGGESSTFMFNGLANSSPISTVIIEGKGSKKKFLQRRVKRLGYIKVFGQILFQLTVPKILGKSSKERIREIKSQYGLDASEIPSQKIKNVPSVNSKECIAFLQKEKPDLIIVNGTRIISKKVLNCIDTTFFNTHVGITPKYRGVHGGYWALANEDKENCGVTVHLVDPGIDTGGVLFQRTINPNEKDNFATYTYLQIGEGIQLMKLAIEDFSLASLRSKRATLRKADFGTIPPYGIIFIPEFQKG